MSYGINVGNITQNLHQWLGLTKTSEAVLINLGQKRSVKLWIEIDNYVTRIDDKNDLDKWFEKYNISGEDEERILKFEFQLDTNYVFTVNGLNKNIRISLI